MFTELSAFFIIRSFRLGQLIKILVDNSFFPLLDGMSFESVEKGFQFRMTRWRTYFIGKFWTSFKICSRIWRYFQEAFSEKSLGYHSMYIQCENFMIFLSLRFYVKSIFGILRSAIPTHLEVLNFNFHEFLHSWKA